MKVNNTVTDVKRRRLVLLIHGLSGSPFTTWVEMLACLSRDVDLTDVELDCYQFPTSLIRWGFFGRRASIEELASGLDTFIKTMHPDKDEIILVGHSLGGVIARYYALERVRASESAVLKGLLLIAVPNTGASLARLATLLSWNHRHAKQLCKGSKLLAELNVEWLKLRIESGVKTRYIVGAGDAVVTPESGRAYAGMADVRTLAEHDHQTIINSRSNADIRYRVVKDFLIEVFSDPRKTALDRNEAMSDRAESSAVPEPVEVLFEVYSKRLEPFYCERSVDPMLNEAISCGHLWVVGPSGVGKTTSLRHTIEQKGWHIEHIMLAAIQNATTLGLARHICNYLYERAGKPDEIVPPTDDLSDILRRLKTVLRVIASGRPTVVFVEEIPLQAGDEYKRFMHFVSHLTSLAESENEEYRLTWVFSSIRDPKGDVSENREKFLNRVFFVTLHPWTGAELEDLFELIQKTLKIAMTSEQKTRVIQAAKGSPRFVKNVFRQRRQEVARKMPFDEFLESISLDSKS